MIELSDDEKRRLAVNYEHIPDRDLIRELLRRGRFREYECSASYWKEMHGEERYMDMMRHGLLHRLAQAVDNDKAALPALVTDRPDVTDAQYRKSILTAGIIVLNARTRKEG